MLQTTGENYYDISDDELPSANFAARPTSEISELGLLDIDGWWTFMSLASICSDNTEIEDDINDGPTPTALTPEISLMPQPKPPQTPPDTPYITVTSPSRRQSLRQRLRSVSDVAAIVRRPSMRRQKSDTAPAGAIEPVDYTPQVPRRAMSARLEKRDAARGRHSRHLTSESGLKARQLLGMPETLLEVRRPKARFSFQRGSGSVDGDEDEDVLPQLNTSFSRKPRVREALERKQLARLRMDFIETDVDEFVDSPQSMLDTPVELYPPPECQPGRFRPTSAINGRRGTSTLVSPRTTLPFRRPQPLSNSMCACDKDSRDLRQTNVYSLGPIRLEKHPALLRRESVATMDPFASEIDSIGRRPSDLIALEQMVVYFDGLGINEGATDVCLDRYWLDGPQQALQGADVEVMELESQTPRSQQSIGSRDASTLSRFSFSSASSVTVVPQGSPQRRQLIRLRKLLSPALPGLRKPEV